MKKFSELVPAKTGNLTGTKYHIDAILNREIHLTGYTVAPSKHNAEPCLTLQYEIEEPLMEVMADGTSRHVIDDQGNQVKGWVQHITFTEASSSSVSFAPFGLKSGIISFASPSTLAGLVVDSAITCPPEARAAFSPLMESSKI